MEFKSPHSVDDGQKKCQYYRKQKYKVKKEIFKEKK